MKSSLATLIAYSLLVADTQAVQIKDVAKVKSIKLHQIEIKKPTQEFDLGDSNEDQDQNKQAPQALSQSQSGKLSDQIIDLGAKLPETKVLEAKLTKMVKLEPTVEKAVESVNTLTTMPTKAEVNAAEAEVNNSVTKIETAVHNEKSETEKNGVTDEPAAATDPLPAMTVGGSVTGEFIAKPAAPEAAAKTEEKVKEAPPASNQLPVAKRDPEAAAVANQMKSSVAAALKSQGVPMDPETQKEINEELKKQTAEFMKKSEFQVKREKYDKMEKEALPNIQKDLYEAVDERLEKVPGGGSFLKNDAPYGTAVDSPVEAIAGVNTNFMAKKVAICKPDEDEVFDNCEMPDDNAEFDEDAEEDAAANPSDEEQSSRAYGFAAMDFLHSVNNELSGNFAVQQNCVCVTIVHCDCPQPTAEEIPLPEEAQADPEKAEEVVAEQVEKAREVADAKIEKIVQKEERKKDGLIDLMSRTLAKNARTKQEISDNRSSIETMVKTRIAAASELGDQVRGALTGGIKATQAKQAPESKKAIEGMALLDEEIARKVAEKAATAAK